MAWPLSQEYNEAVQNPRTSFGDPDLKAGEVVVGPLGIPMPRSGNFADVYQVRGADGRMWALKCFTRPAVGLRERYLKIDEQLREARLPFSVGFEFLPEGVRIRGLWFPALKMEWVEGLQLNQFVRENVERRDNLKALLGMWIRLCRRLRDADIAHADLQHGNVLLVPGATANTLKLRLIDYDGMWVPALATSPSGEAGHPNYQHPARLREHIYTSDVDRFPHLVIGCSLRALAIAGKPLWDRFDNGDNLLFREADFANPRKSELFRALWDLDDPTVTNLVALLIASAQRPIGDTPWLDEVLAGDSPVPVSDAVLAYAADTLGVARRAVRKGLPVAQIYVVPQEANEFTELGWSARTRRKRGISATTAALVGGSIIAVAAIVGIVIAVNGKSATDPIDPGSPPTNTQPVDKGTTPVVKSGTIDTKWTVIPAGPPMPGAKALVSGIDTAPPATKVIRSFNQPGAASLGAWFLPDGTSALVAGRTGLGILDLHTKQLRPLPRTAGQHTRIAVTPDCLRAISVEPDQSIRCIDLATGDLVWTQKFPGPIAAMAITPDGQRVATSADKVGYMEWAIENGAELRRHELLQASHFAFSPDGKWAIAAAESGVELWSLDDASVTELAPKLSATAVCISPDGKHAFAAAATIKSWELPDAQPLPDRATPIKSSIGSLTVTIDGAIVVTGQSGEVGLIGPDDSATITVEPAGPVTAMAITADGQHGLLATEKSGPALCRVGDLVRPFGPSKLGPNAGCLEFVRSVTIPSESKVFAADARGERFLTASDSRIVVYDSAKFQRVDGFQLKGGKIVSAGFGGDGTVVLCELEDDQYQTRAFELKKADPGARFSIPMIELGQVSRIVAVAEHTWALATTDPAGDVLFDVSTGKPVEGWPAPRAADPAVATPSRDGRYIAVGSANNPVGIWSSDTASVLRRCEASTGAAALAYTPDGTKLVGLWPQGRIRVWDPVTGNLIAEVDHRFTGPFTEIAAISNEVVVLGSGAGRLLFNIDTGKALNTGDGPDPLENRGIVVPSRGWALAVDRDERLTAWRVNAKLADSLPAKSPRRSMWPEIAVVRDAPADPIAGIAFSPDGDQVIVATQDGKLSRYSADRLQFIREVETGEAPVRSMVQVGERLFVLGRKGTVMTRDAKDLDKQVEFAAPTLSGGMPALFAVHPDSSHFLVVTDKLRVVDTKTKKETNIATVPKIAMGKPLTQFAYSLDGQVGIARWGDAITAMWHPKLTGNAKILEELRTPLAASPHALALSNDGKVAILGTGDGRIRAWNTSTGDVLHTEDVYPPAGTGDSVSGILMHPSGKHFLSAGRDGRVILWELDGFKKVKEYRGPEGPWRLALSPNARGAVLIQPGMMERIELPDLPKRVP